MIENIKRPILEAKLIKQADSSPNLQSHLGGKPYLPKGEKIPSCQLCNNDLSFIFQLHIPSTTNKNESTLYAFYYCFDCFIDYGDKGFQLMKYKNPDMEKSKKRFQVKDPIPYCDFHFTPKWSLPDWETLLAKESVVADILTNKYKDEAFDVYDAIRENIVGYNSFHIMSFYKGYPHFSIGHESLLCNKCNEEMESWFQLASYEQLDLIWDDLGNLHILQCPNHPDEFKILMQ